ncbi:MAG: hypothetical protein AAGK21_14825 [Bacteroidota bacterium]
MRSLSTLLASGALLLAACEGDTGPPSTSTDSSEIETLDGRVAFLDAYLGSRPYADLPAGTPADSGLVFSVWYQNNESGILPGPSDWMIDVVARVPPNSLDSWREGIPRADSVEGEWLRSRSSGPPVDGINEWYGDSSRLVGIDRQRGVVAFRWSTF